MSPYDDHHRTTETESPEEPVLHGTEGSYLSRAAAAIAWTLGLITAAAGVGFYVIDPHFFAAVRSTLLVFALVTSFAVLVHLTEK